NGKRKIPQKEEFNSGEKIPTSASTEHNTDQIDLDAFSLSTHEQRLTLSEVTSLPMLSYSSEAALVTKIPTTPKNQKIDIIRPIQQKINLRPLRPQLIGSIGPDDCCFTVYSKPISIRRITSYYKTDPWCPVRTAILIIKSGYRICVDPEQPWVEKIINFLE
ncbi:hypothetical protein AMECASPLE_032721, partial [Ameca splendens]